MKESKYFRFVRFPPFSAAAAIADILASAHAASMTLEAEERRASEMLAGKTVKGIRRHRPAEVLIEFTDGTRLFVDADSPVELSTTGEIGGDS